MNFNAFNHFKGGDSSREIKPPNYRPSVVEYNALRLKRDKNLSSKRPKSF